MLLFIGAEKQSPDMLKCKICKASFPFSELEKAARGTRSACGHFFRIEDILVQKSGTYVEIADLCSDFDLF